MKTTNTKLHHNHDINNNKKNAFLFLIILECLWKLYSNGLIAQQTFWCII